MFADSSIYRCRFAEKTIIGKGITERVGKYPDPTQHWAVIVGDYVHQLWMVRFWVMRLNNAKP
jgi:hypothetical protein